MILTKIRLFGAVGIDGGRPTGDHHMRFKAEQTKDHRVRETHKPRTFVVDEGRHELGDGGRLDCLRHTTRETRLQQIKNLQHIALDDQLGSSAENGGDEMILMTYLGDPVRTQRTGRASHLTEMCEQTILTLDVCQDGRVFQELTLKAILV